MEDAVRRLPHPSTETIIHIFINLYRLINPFRFCYLARGPLLRAGLFGSDGWSARLATTKGHRLPGGKCGQDSWLFRPAGRRSHRNNQ
jgi:hypothetical protein